MEMDTILAEIQDASETKLNLSYFKEAQPGETQTLIAALRDSNIKSLRLDEQSGEQASNSLIIQSLPNTSVQSLSIRQANDETIESLIELLKAGTLTRLELSGGVISDVHLPALKEAIQNSSLTHLELNGVKLGSHGLAEILRIVPDSNITTLHAKPSFPRDSTKDFGWFEAVAEILPNGKLTELELYNCDLNDDQLKTLAEKLPQSSVKHLSLGANEYGFEGVQHMAEALPTTQIESLKLPFGELEEEKYIEAMESLASALPQSKLTSLDLSNSSSCKWSAEELQPLASALPNSHITSLNLTNFNLETETAELLGNAVKNSPISEINLSRCFFAKPEAFIKFASFLPQSAITKLQLYGNTITPEVAVDFAKYLPSTKIEALSLSGNSLCTEGVETVVSSLPHTIRSLDLRATEIGSSVYDRNSESKGDVPPEEERIDPVDVIANMLTTLPLDTLDLSDNPLRANQQLDLVERTRNTHLRKLRLSNRWNDNEGIMECRRNMSVLHKKMAEAAELLISGRVDSECWQQLCDHALPATRYLQEEKGWDASAIKALIKSTLEKAHGANLPLQPFIFRTLPVDKANEELEKLGAPITIGDFLQPDGSMPLGRYICQGGIKALFERSELWQSAAQIKHVYHRLPKATKGTINNIHQLVTTVTRERSIPQQRG